MTDRHGGQTATVGEQWATLCAKFPRLSDRKIRLLTHQRDKLLAKRRKEKGGGLSPFARVGGGWRVSQPRTWQP